MVVYINISGNICVVIRDYEFVRVNITERRNVWVWTCLLNVLKTKVKSGNRLGGSLLSITDAILCRYPIDFSKKNIYDVILLLHRHFLLFFPHPLSGTLFLSLLLILSLYISLNLFFSPSPFPFVTLSLSFSFSPSPSPSVSLSLPSLFCLPPLPFSPSFYLSFLHSFISLPLSISFSFSLSRPLLLSPLFSLSLSFFPSIFLSYQI